MELEYSIIGVLWIICVIISYGYQFAYYQREFPLLVDNKYKEDMVFSIFVSLFGPINIVSIIMRREYQHGVKFK